MPPRKISSFGSLEQSIITLMQTPYGKELAHNCYYDWNVVNACARFNESEEWQAVTSLLRKLTLHGTEVLDLGAGNGIASYSLAKLGYSVTAIEPDPSDLVGYGAIKEMSESTKSSINILSSVGEHLPFSDDYFSLVYTRQVLHHADNLGRMLKEISRVLKPKGILIATREHVIDDQKSLEIFLDRHPLHIYTRSEWAYTESEYIEQMRSANLKTQYVIHPWDSVINHFPITNGELNKKMEFHMRKYFGILGMLIIHLPSINKIYRAIKSYRDSTPGRVFTFVAIVNETG